MVRTHSAHSVSLFLSYFLIFFSCFPLLAKDFLVSTDLPAVMAQYREPQQSQFSYYNTSDDPWAYSSQSESTFEELLWQEACKDADAQEYAKRQKAKKEREAHRLKLQEESDARIRASVQPQLQAQQPELIKYTRYTQQLQEQLSTKGIPQEIVQNRQEYFEAYELNSHHWEHKTHQLPQEARTLLSQHSLQSEHYSSLYGTIIQHGIHKEIITILTRTHTKRNHDSDSKSTLSLTTFIVLSAEHSRNYNTRGDVLKSLEINDLCFHMLQPKLQGSLAGQLAKSQAYAMEENAANWAPTLQFLQDAAEHDKNIATCITTAQVYTQHFRKTDAVFAMQALCIMTEMCLDEMEHLPMQEQCTLLKEYHESITIKALRALNNGSNDIHILKEWAIDLLKLENGQNQLNKKTLNILLQQEKSHKRISDLIRSIQHPAAYAALLTEQGILKEYALIAAAHKLPIPPSNSPKQPMLVHDCIYTYCTSTVPQQQDAARHALSFAVHSTACTNVQIAKSYDEFAQMEHKASYNGDYALDGWNELLDQNYATEMQQESHDRLVCLTHNFLCAQSTLRNNTSEIVTRLLNDIANRLELAHAHNQLYNSVQARKCLNTIEAFSSGNLAGGIKNIGAQLPKAITAIEVQAYYAGAGIENVSNQIYDELSRLYIQNGTLIRDYSQLSQQKIVKLHKREALRFGRSKELKEDLEEYARKKFDKKFAKRIKKLTPWQYHEYKKEYVESYYDKKVNRAHNSIKSKLDHITTHLDKNSAALPVSDVFGFIINPQQETPISFVDQTVLAEFKDNWPEPKAVSETSELWQEEIDLYPRSSQPLVQERYLARQRAYEKTGNNPCIFITRKYTLSNSAEQALRSHNIDQELFTHGIYNPAQHQLHTELVDILEQVTNLQFEPSANEILQPSTTMMLDTISTAAYANKQGDILTAWNLADFCWAALDCGKALMEGVMEGAIDVAMYTVNNPGEMVLYTVAGKYMLYYQAAKLAYHLGNTAINTLIYSEEEQNIDQDQKAPDEPLKFRDLLKGASSFATQIYLNHKLNQQISKYLSITKNAITDKVDKLKPKSKTRVGKLPKVISKQKIQKTNTSSKLQKGSSKIPKPPVSFKQELKKVMQKKHGHIFSKNHKTKGILNLGKDEQDICEKVFNKILTAHKYNLLQEGPNQILTKFNNLDATIRIFIESGKPISLNLWARHATRILGNSFNI